jgi:hypothetical protein
MKTKVFFLNLVMMLVFGTVSRSQTAAVTNLSTQGVNLTPEIAGKMTRIELTKTEKYKVLDQFDMESALEGKSEFTDCYGKTCLIKIGQAMKVDFVFSGSIDLIGEKIVINLKMIDVVNKELKLTKSIEFDNQPLEISRMLEITLKEMLGLPINPETKKSLVFQNEVITSSNVGRINNSGPRYGIALAPLPNQNGLNDFLTRSESEGGLDILPIMSNIGYQFEVQYIGTENFSALFEFIPNIAGMEQGHFIPTLSLLNGFRFGQAGWEFAFGPSFGARKMLSGYLNPEDGIFYSESQWFDKDFTEWAADPNNVDPVTGNWINTHQGPSKSIYSKRLDTRGNLEFNTNWLMAVGRTFKSGALNIPVNLYYSGNKYGGVIGSSVGFNIVKQKKSINQKF